MKRSVAVCLAALSLAELRVWQAVAKHRIASTNPVRSTRPRLDHKMAVRSSAEAVAASVLQTKSQINVVVANSTPYIAYNLAAQNRMVIQGACASVSSEP